jgi:hypothetical protein
MISFKRNSGWGIQGVRPTHFTFLRGVTRRWAEPTLPAVAEAVSQKRQPVVGSQ